MKRANPATIREVIFGMDPGWYWDIRNREQIKDYGFCSWVWGPRVSWFFIGPLEVQWWR